MDEFVVTTDDPSHLRPLDFRPMLLDRPDGEGMFLWWRKSHPTPGVINVRPGDNGFWFVIGATAHDRPDNPQELSWFMNFMGKGCKFQRVSNPLR